MFIMRCSSFHSTVPCLFEFIWKPESSLQECYMLLTAVCLQNLVIWLFHSILCVHPMSMSSTCVWYYNMPSLQGCLSCIFVIYVVTSTSMQSSLRDVADFCDLVISAKSESVIWTWWFFFFIAFCVCASYGHEIYMCFDLHHAILTLVLVLYF